MEPTKPTSPTINATEARVMRDILTPLCPIMEEALPRGALTEDEIFFDIALPLLTHLCCSLMEIVSTALLWTQIQEMIQLKCVVDGQWCWMGDYMVLMVKFGICNALVTSMLLTRSIRMAHWGPLHMCVMRLIPRATLLSTEFFDERETYTANLSRLWPATNWGLGTSCEGHLDWIEGQFTLRALINSELLNLDDVGVEADVYQLREAAFNKKELEERD